MFFLLMARWIWVFFRILCFIKYIKFALSLGIMLKTKSFLEPIKSSDGVRISVVGKHEWDAGIMTYTDLTSIEPWMYDEWMKIFAPPLKLVGDLYIRKSCSHEEFRERYFGYLSLPKVDVEVRRLAKRSAVEDVSVLCLEPSPEYCHRRYLAERCGEYEGGLVLDIR